MAATNGSDGHAPMSGETINTDIVTLTRFLTEEQRKHKEATGDFTYVAWKASPVFRPLVACHC